MQDKIIEALRRNAADDAVTLARQWVETEPQLPQAHRWLALALQQQGQHPAALESIEQALALAPEDADLHLQRAGLLLAARQLQDADSALARSTELDPNQFSAYLMQAHLALARGDLEEAERLSRTAARLEPDHAQLATIDGLLALRRGDAERALALLSAASEQLPDDPRVLYALGFAYLHKQHLAFAERAFRRVIELAPVAATTLWALVAQLAQRQGHIEEAIEAMGHVLADPAGDVPAMRRLAGEFQLQAGRPAEALEHLRPVLAAAPEDRRSLQAALIAWERLGAADDARGTLDAALATTTDVHELWLARLAVEPVGSEQALAVIERWVAAMPGHLPALEAQMRISDMRDDPAAAEAVARRIVALEPGRISGEQRIVDALLLRDPPAAVKHVEKLIEAAPEQVRPELQQWLGLVQDRAGCQSEAVSSWLAFHREQAPSRLPLPPQGQAAQEWPPLAEVGEQMQTRPLLLWGAPGAGVERVAAVLGVSPRFRADRFGPNPPDDAFQKYTTVDALASGTLEPATLVAQWRERMPARGLDNDNMIDWLLWWDNTLLQALRPQLPEGRLLIALRDPRDMLLDWLAYGAPMPLAVTSVNDAANWLAGVLGQVAVLHEQDLYPHRLVRLDGIESDPQAVAQAVGQALGFTVQVPPSVGLPRLASGRWRHFAQVLAMPFSRLAPVAVRLGYPEV